jgi:hypothetical protein
MHDIAFAERALLFCGAFDFPRTARVTTGFLTAVWNSLRDTVKVTAGRYPQLRQ